MTENEGEESPEPGRMRFQDESTTPREPTLAERRAREQAARRAEEARRAEAEQEAKSKRRRKRILIGTGVTVGIVAVIAVGYALAQPDDQVQAQCVDEETGLVVDDSNCVTPAASRSYYGSGGYPIFIGVGGRQYRYNYGGSGTLGQPASGGTATPPKEGTTVVSSSGRTLSGGSSSSSGTSSSSSGSDTVSRGGLGVSGDGSSSGS